MNRKVKRALLIAGVFGVAVLGYTVLSQMKPAPETRDTPNSAPLVEVLTLDAFNANFRIQSQGTVRPRTETVLSAEDNRSRRRSATCM